MAGNKGESLIAMGKHLPLHDGRVGNEAEVILDGTSEAQFTMRLPGIEALERYIVDEVREPLSTDLFIPAEHRVDDT